MKPKPMLATIIEPVAFVNESRLSRCNTILGLILVFGWAVRSPLPFLEDGLSLGVMFMIHNILGLLAGILLAASRIYSEWQRGRTL